MHCDRLYFTYYLLIDNIHIYLATSCRFLFDSIERSPPQRIGYKASARKRSKEAFEKLRTEARQFMYRVPVNFPIFSRIRPVYQSDIGGTAGRRWDRSERGGQSARRARDKGRG